ncbi:DgyrCDS6455 [Dimorphilus gyrociliatus]|uniref:DgyrCDS6455 n=1 Tax=Dimorphilus gyrociliatus TaxID=2664684 RepID=A0A7I8VQE6_9ANNE|nr:DgyrCDS6455 [Dimorphilus gyrociliatus]
MVNVKYTDKEEVEAEEEEEEEEKLKTKKNEKKQVKIIDKTMERCDKNNCFKRNIKSPSFHESWDRSLPTMDPNSPTDRPISGILKNKVAKEEEYQENPFKSDGELSRIADYILRNSLISRTSVYIADPDIDKPEVEDENLIDQTITVPNQQSAPSDNLQTALKSPRKDNLQLKDKKKKSCCVIS